MGDSLLGQFVTFRFDRSAVGEESNDTVGQVVLATLDVFGDPKKPIKCALVIPFGQAGLSGDGRTYRGRVVCEYVIGNEKSPTPVISYITPLH